MKRPIPFLLITIAALSAWAKPPKEGGNSGGGGGVIFCKPETGRPSYQLFDIGEFQHGNKDFYFPAAGSPNKLKDFGNKSYLEILNELNRNLGAFPASKGLSLEVGPVRGERDPEKLFQKILFQKKYIVDIKYSKDLVFPAFDVGPYDPKALPAGCKLQWLAYFNDNFNELNVNLDIFEKIPENEKAALLVHEFIYWLSRSKRLTYDSAETRHAMGYLFSENSAAFGGTDTRGILRLSAIANNEPGWNTSMPGRMGVIQKFDLIELKMLSLAYQSGTGVYCNGSLKLETTVKMCIRYEQGDNGVVCSGDLARFAPVALTPGKRIELNESVKLSGDDLLKASLEIQGKNPGKIALDSELLVEVKKDKGICGSVFSQARNDFSDVAAARKISLRKVEKADAQNPLYEIFGYRPFSTDGRWKVNSLYREHPIGVTADFLILK